MAPFRWPKIEYDIALCKEAIDVRPSKHEDWEQLANKLTGLFGLEEPLKGRGCREHLELLIKKFKAEERKALKRYVICMKRFLQLYIISIDLQIDRRIILYPALQVL